MKMVCLLLLYVDLLIQWLVSHARRIVYIVVFLDIFADLIYLDWKWVQLKVYALVQFYHQRKKNAVLIGHLLWYLLCYVLDDKYNPFALFSWHWE